MSFFELDKILADLGLTTSGQNKGTINYTKNKNSLKQSSSSISNSFLQTTENNSSIETSSSQNIYSELTAEEKEILQKRPHAPTDDKGEHERYAIKLDDNQGKPVVSLIEFSFQNKKLKTKLVDKRSFLMGATEEQIKETVLTFSKKAQDLEYLSAANNNTTTQQTQTQIVALTSLAAEEIDQTENNPTLALRERKHAHQFPGVEHKAYCIQMLITKNGNPMLRLLRFNPAFPGRPERTEMHVEREMVFDTNDIAYYTEIAAKWSIDAMELEQTAYKPILEKEKARQEKQQQEQAVREQAEKQHAEAKAVLDAARKALE